MFFSCIYKVVFANVSHFGVYIQTSFLYIQFVSPSRQKLCLVFSPGSLPPLEDFIEVILGIPPAHLFWTHQIE